MAEPSEQESYDVVVIGAGVAGAILAWKLASLDSSKKILLLDAGSNEINPSQSDLVGLKVRKRMVDTFAVQLDKSVLAPYRRLESNKFVPSPEGGVDKKHFIQSGPDSFKSNYVRMVGGTSFAWRGNCPRWVPNDFRLRSEYGLAEDWPFTYDDIESYFCQAEQELGVSGDHAEQVALNAGNRSQPYPMPKIVQAYGDTIVKGRVDGMSVKGKTITVVATPQARNSITYQGRSACQGNANCIPICPSGAKYDASVHIAKAKNLSVATRWNCVVTRLEVGSNGRIKAVYFRDWKRPEMLEQSIMAKVFVLATHAIETPRLWMLSKLDNSRDLMGRFLMDHLAHEVAGYMDVPIFPFRGPQNTSSIFDFRDGPFRKTNAAFNVTIGNDGWGRKLAPSASFDKAMWDSSKGRIKAYGKKLRDELVTSPKSITRMIRIGFSTEQLPESDNRVTLGDEKDPMGLVRPKINYKVSDYSIRSLEYAHEVAAEILEKAVGNSGIVDHTVDPDPSFNGAGHPMGTCRMGTSATNSIVDSYGRSHAHPNLFVAGSSTFVTGSSVNPTLLLAALAIRTAEQIKLEI